MSFHPDMHPGDNPLKDHKICPFSCQGRDKDPAWISAEGVSKGILSVALFKGVAAYQRDKTGISHVPPASITDENLCLTAEARAVIKRDNTH
jgi:hypothetical protein